MTFEQGVAGAEFRENLVVGHAAIGLPREKWVAAGRCVVRSGKNIP